MMMMINKQIKLCINYCIQEKYTVHIIKIQYVSKSRQNVDMFCKVGGIPTSYFSLHEEHDTHLPLVLLAALANGRRAVAGVCCAGVLPPKGGVLKLVALKLI